MRVLIIATLILKQMIRLQYTRLSVQHNKQDVVIRPFYTHHNATIRHCRYDLFGGIKKQNIVFPGTEPPNRSYAVCNSVICPTTFIFWYRVSMRVVGLPNWILAGGDFLSR